MIREMVYFFRGISLILFWLFIIFGFVAPDTANKFAGILVPTVCFLIFIIFASQFVKPPPFATYQDFKDFLGGTSLSDDELERIYSHLMVFHKMNPDSTNRRIKMNERGSQSLIHFLSMDNPAFPANAKLENLSSITTVGELVRAVEHLKKDSEVS